jgi:hypothetical protein
MTTLMNESYVGAPTKVLVGFSPVPVYIDGITTSLSYVFLAVKEADQYNCVCYSGHLTLKFYPSADFWGITQGTLEHLGITASLYRRGQGYQGLHKLGTDEVQKILGIIRNQRGVGCVDDQQLSTMFSVYDRQYSRALHPSTSGKALSVSQLPRMEDLIKIQQRLGSPVRVPSLGYEGQPVGEVA